MLARCQSASTNDLDGVAGGHIHTEEHHTQMLQAGRDDSRTSSRLRASRYHADASRSCSVGWLEFAGYRVVEGRMHSFLVR